MILKLVNQLIAILILLIILKFPMKNNSDRKQPIEFINFPNYSPENIARKIGRKMKNCEDRNYLIIARTLTLMHMLIFLMIYQLLIPKVS